MKLSIRLLSIAFLVLASIRLDRKHIDCLLFFGCAFALVALSEMQVQWDQCIDRKTNPTPFLQRRFPISIGGKFVEFLSMACLAGYFALTLLVG